VAAASVGWIAARRHPFAGPADVRLGHASRQLSGQVVVAVADPAANLCDHLVHAISESDCAK
jgi:hypothetical protein